MDVIGDYHAQGYSHLKGLFPLEVTRAFMQSLKEDLGPAAVPVSRATTHSEVLKRPAFEIYGPRYKPMDFFLWALTPIVSELVGKDLLPTYDYFRLYAQGDVCRVHRDRGSCEHSVSLTLDYSDDRIWELQVGQQRREGLQPMEDGFGDEPFSSIAMRPGDAVLYKGVEHRHGRIEPNPNRWSAHLFLHWVDPTGPWKGNAFDGRSSPAKVDFTFA
jgi:hypothetical protein